MKKLKLRFINIIFMMIFAFNFSYGNQLDKYFSFIHDNQYIYPDSVLKISFVLEKKIESKKNRHSLLVEIYSIIGNVYWFKGNFSNAINYYRKVYQSATLVKDKSRQSKALADIGYVYSDLAKNDSAMYYFIQAKRIADKANDVLLQNTIKMFLADHYVANEKFKSALDNYRSILIFFTKTNKSYDIASAKSNIANCYINLRQYDSAEYYIKRSISDFENLKMYSELGENYITYASLLHKKKEGLNNIIAKFHLAQENFKKTGSEYNLLESYITEAYYNLMFKQFLESIKFYQKALEISKKNDYFPLQRTSYLGLVNCYKALQKFKLAFNYYEKYQNVNKIIDNQESNKLVEELKTKYQTEKKEQKINLLSTEKRLQQDVIYKQKLLQWFLIVIAFMLVLICFFIYKNFIQKRKDNEIISQQKFEIEHKHKEITDSITYAKRIQSAILPQEKLIKNYFPNSFILYKPKDIVAGDFYWFEVIEDFIFFAAADCTGHGVPGAMVSVVCHNALNRSVKEYNLKKPSDILDKTREIVIAEFEKSDEDVKDGMDISLVALRFRARLENESEDNSLSLPVFTLSWAGAHNPLWILRKASAVNELVEFKGDKQPIGKYAYSKPFTNHEIELQTNDEIYIFTDGFQDQFGGPSTIDGGKKFKASQMRALFLSLTNYSLDEKKTKIDEAFKNWKGKLEQVDDVCIIGMRI